MFSNIIRGIGRGAASVGRAVANASRKVDEAVTPPQAVTPQDQAALPAPAEGAPAAPATPFTLPDLGPGPDASAAEFQGDEGKARLQRAQAEYQHKQEIHQAFQDLDKIYSEAHPGRDFAKEYRDELAAMKQHEAERPQGSGLARAALALGDFNPAVQQSGRSNLDEYNKGIDAEAKRSDASFAQRMTLRQNMHEAAAADAAAKGNWKKALAEQEKLALLKSDEDALKQERDLEKTALIQKETTNRANIRRESVENSAKIRAQTIASTHGLSGNFLTQFEKEAAKAVAKLLGPRDLTKEYSPADVESISDYLEHLAEMFHDQQHGTEDGGANYLKTHPSKRTAPTPTKKEQF